MMKATKSKITQSGLKALSKSPGEQTSLERKQARRTEKALKEKKRLQKIADAAERKRIQEGLKKFDKYLGKYRGIKRLAYRVKLFWAIENTRPKRFYDSKTVINLADFDLLKAATIALAKQCYENYEYGDEAVKIWTLLESPPPGTRRANIAATCRVFADKVLDGER